MCKCIHTYGCCDVRCSVPCDDDVPCACALLGLFCAGKKMSQEATPMIPADGNSAPQGQQMARGAPQFDPVTGAPANYPPKAAILRQADSAGPHSMSMERGSRQYNTQPRDNVPLARVRFN